MVKIKIYTKINFLKSQGSHSSHCTTSIKEGKPEEQNTSEDIKNVDNWEKII